MVSSLPWGIPPVVLRLQIVGCDPSLRHVRSGIQHGNNRMVPLFLKPSLGQFSFETDVWEPPLGTCRLIFSAGGCDAWGTSSEIIRLVSSLLFFWLGLHPLKLSIGCCCSHSFASAPLLTNFRSRIYGGLTRWGIFALELLCVENCT